jgi:hypothetical protein
MATGDSLFVLLPLNSIPPATLYATLDVIADGSTPVMHTPVLDFDGSQDEHSEWVALLPSHYSGDTGLTFSYKFAMSGTDGSDVQMEFRVLPITDGLLLTSDMGMDGQTKADLTATPDAAANEVKTSGTVALAKASFGSAAAGSYIRIRASRDYNHAANTDDLQLLSILVTET